MQLITGFSCNCVVWLHSLPADEMGPTNRMIQAMEAHSKDLGFAFRHVEITSRTHLMQVLDEIAVHARDLNMKPLIHFDTHGNKDDGLWIATEDDFAGWSELADRLRAINIHTRNNLAVVGGTCYGLHAIRPINLSTATPFFLLLSPEEKVGVGFLENNVPPFYRALFEGGSVGEAYSRHLADKFKYFHCEKMLFIVIARYIANGCKGKSGAERRERLLTEVLSQGVEPTPENLKNIRQRIKDGLRPNQSLIDRYAGQFLIGRQCSFSMTELLDFVESNEG